MIRAQIIGTGGYAPEKVVTNADLAKIVETSDEWIVDRTGIRERRMAADDEVTSDMAVKAAIRALEMANTRVDEIDMIGVFGALEIVLKKLGYEKFNVGASLNAAATILQEGF